MSPAPRSTRRLVAGARVALPLVALPLLAVSVFGSGCKRPVTGRDFSGATVRDLMIAPDHVRAGVPIDVRFRLDGGPEGAVTMTIGGHDETCTPEPLADGAFKCTHPGVTRRDYSQGPTQLTLKAKDRIGRESEASLPLAIDFECPQIATLEITPPIGSPGATAILRVEANELLREPPIVSRGGQLWETAEGGGTTYTVSHPITESDMAATSDIVVRIVDLAGNTSGDCGIDGRIPFGVDRQAPAVDATLVEVRRDIPGQPATLTAQPGAFTDDVGVKEVRIYDEDQTGTATLVATLVPGLDGAIPRTSLGVEPRGRTRVEAIDVADKTSDAVLVKERWRLSVGMGAAQNAAIRTAIRYSAAPPRSPAMDDRTRELALKIYAADTESADVTADVGFRTVGQLPTSYRDTSLMATGYDAIGGAILGFGGQVKNVDGQRGETLVLRWNGLTHEYEPEVLAESAGTTPEARWAQKIAFDGAGCGVMFGGERNDRLLNDTWKICRTPMGGYAWSRVDAAQPPTGRLAPIAWDPILRRYAITSGLSGLYGFDAYYLDPAPDGQPWQWVRLAGFPDDLYGQRFFHFLYFEPRIRGLGMSLGVAPSYYSSADFWSYADGAWTLSRVPLELAGRVGFGWDYDTARETLVLWGDGADQFVRQNDPPPVLDPDTWLLAGDPRTGAQAWRRTNLGPSIVRGFPSVVYDADRETMIVFGGVRTLDQTSVPPTIEEMITSPSFPELQATLDLGTSRPRGISSLHLALRAVGSGDGDGVGPTATRAGGVTVLLWNHVEAHWEEVESVDTPPAGSPVAITVDMTDRPERFVSLDGVVPVTLLTRWPATEDVNARLSVDLIDGDLVLASELPTGARIEDFTVTPAMVSRGQPITIAWSVSNAPDGMELLADGTSILTSTQAVGSLETIPDTTTTYELRAKNTLEGGTFARRQVAVRPVEAPPIILGFDSAKPVVPRGGAARLTWQIGRASLVRVLRGRTEVFASSMLASAGGFDAIVPLGTTDTSTTFTIEAKSDAGRELREVHVRLAAATVLRGPGSSYTWSESIASVGEHDLFVLDLTAPGYVDASVWVPTPGLCDAGIDTYMYLRDATLSSITSNDDGDYGDCSQFDSTSNRYLLVPAGTYYLEVQQYSDDSLIPAYQLEVRLTPTACGNGIREIGESCDDGNTVSGDGCSAACRFESLGVYNAPGDGHVAFSDAISPIGNIDTYEIVVTSPAFVTFQLYVPTEASASCGTSDTYLELFAEDGTTRLAYDDDDGVGYCSLISMLLAPGTYYAAAHDLGDNGLIPAYQIAFDSVGNLTPETEPNDDVGHATSLGSVAPGSVSAPISAAISPAGEADYFSFELTAVSAVTITTYTTPGDRTACDSIDTQMRLLDANQVELVFNDDGGGGYCSLIDGIGGAYPAAANLAPGTYYVRINEYGDDDVIPGYFVDVQVQ